MPDAWQSAVFFFGGSETVGTPTPNPLARCWSGPTSVRSPSLVTCHSLDRAMTSLWMNPAVDAAAERAAAATAGLPMAAGTPVRAEVLTQVSINVEGADVDRSCPGRGEPSK